MGHVVRCQLGSQISNLLILLLISHYGNQIMMDEMVSKGSMLVNAAKYLHSFWFENLKRTDHLEDLA
jgi:hypothetical protein